MTTATTTTLIAMECQDCKAMHPEGIACCPGCGSENIEKKESSGKGSIYTYTVMNFVPVGPHKGRAPYVIAVVETDEGMRLSAIVETDNPEGADIGDKVTFKEYVEGTGWFFQKA